MAKLRKKARANDDKCKKMHMDMNLAGNPTRLEPRLFLIMDTDELQKQVNRLENLVYRLERNQAVSNWKHRARRKRR